MAPKKVTPAGRAAPAPKATPAKQSAKKKASTSQKKTATSTSRYIRNLRYAAGGVRIDLADRRIHLEPRGQVGDLAAISKDDREDPIYQRNLGTLFEEISKVEADSVIQKQNTNAQGPRQGTMDILRDEHGKAYPNPVKIEKSFEEQGAVVGQVSVAKEGVSANNTGNIERSGLEPAEVQVPGSRPAVSNAMPEGLTEPQAIEYLNTPPEQRADFLARIRGGGEAGASAAAEAYRDSLRVSIEPTQRQ